MAKKRRKNGDYFYEVPKIINAPQKKKSTANKLLIFGALLLTVGLVSCLYFLLIYLDEHVWMLNLPLFQIMAILAGAIITAMFALTLMKTVKYERLDENGEIMPISAADAVKYEKLKKYIKILAFVFICVLMPITIDIVITFFLS